MAVGDIKERLELEVRPKDNDVQPNTKASRIAALARIYARWRQKQTLPSIGAITLPCGAATSGPSFVAQELTRRWQSIFSKSPSNPGGVNTFTGELMPRFPTIE